MARMGAASPTFPEVALSADYAFVLHSRKNRSRTVGLAVSVLLHVAVVVLLLIPLRQDFARVLSAGDPVAISPGGGGRRVAYISLPAPRATARAAVEVPPPVTLVVPATPPPEIPPPEPATQIAVVEPAAVAISGADSSAGAAAGEGGGTGGGVGPGSGPGRGPGAGEGGAGRAPQLRHQVIPPEKPPKELRGVDLTVTFWIDDAGKVVRVAVDPPIHDRKFAQAFTETMFGYRFRPALGPDGRPVASTHVQTVSY